MQITIKNLDNTLSDVTYCLTPESSFNNIVVMSLSKSEQDKIYRREHKEQIAAYFKKLWQDPERRAKNKLYKQLQRFGINADEFVSDKNCENCGISNKDYIAKTGRRLDINHVDDNGRKALRLRGQPNNTPDNFMVMCRGCHTSWHNKNVRIYGNKSTQSL